MGAYKTKRTILWTLNELHKNGIQAIELGEFPAEREALNAAKRIMTKDRHREIFILGFDKNDITTSRYSTGDLWIKFKIWGRKCIN